MASLGRQLLAARLPRSSLLASHATTAPSTSRLLPVLHHSLVRFSSSSSSSSPSLPPIYYSHIPHLVPYTLGLALQEHIYSLRGDPEVLLLLEHTPVYTEGRRGPEGGSASLEGQRLKGQGADYHIAKRGGLITYHGPGQLVGYPILHLGKMDLSTRCYISDLQKALSAVLSSYSLPTVPPPSPDHTGVWSDFSHKIVSIGVQVRHRISTHGFALNVTTDVTPWFEKIVACGLSGKKMTNMQVQRAKKIQLEEVNRPDRGGSPRADERTERGVEGMEKSNDLQEQEEETSRQEEDEKDIVIGPESKLITVSTVAPRVAHALGQTLNREIKEADEDLLRYEADEKNVLTRVWVRGHEVKVEEAGEEVVDPQPS